jgi:hypothetical protein
MAANGVIVLESGIRRVTLTEMEVRLAVMVGGERQLQALLAGLEDNPPCKEAPGFDRHIVGALGECAYCKALNRYWCPTVNTFKRVADVGEKTEIRTRTRFDFQLYVRPDDFDDRYYVLVRGVCPTYDVVGYMLGKDAKQQEWLDPKGGYAPAYFVPDDKLTIFPVKTNGR